jgi:hypothetical protein
MAIEVASLLARVELELAGVADATRQLQRFSSDLTALGDTAEASKLDRLADRISLLGERAQAQRGEVARLDAQWRQLNTTIEQARAAASQASPIEVMAEQTGRSVEELEKAAAQYQNALNSLAKGGYPADVGDRALNQLARTLNLTREQLDLLTSATTSEAAEGAKAVAVYEARARAAANLISTEAQLAAAQEQGSRAIAAYVEGLRQQNAALEEVGSRGLQQIREFLTTPPPPPPDLLAPFITQLDQAAQAAASFRDQLVEVDPSGALKFDRLSTELGGFISAIQTGVSEIVELEMAISQSGMTLQEAMAWMTRAANASQELENATKEEREEFARNIQAAEGLIQKLRELAQARREVGQATQRAQGPLDEVRRVIDFGRGSREAAKGTQVLAQALKFNRTELTSFLYMLRSGRVSMTAFSQVLFRVGSALKATAASSAGLAAALKVGLGLLAPIAAGAALGAAAYGVLRSKVGQLAQQLTVAGPLVRSLTEDFQALGAVDLSGLTAQLENAVSRFKSFGFEDPGAVAGEVAEIANVIQYLNGVAGDWDRAFQAVQRSIERGIADEGLRDFGVEVDRINAKLQNLQRQGASEPALRQVLAQMLGDVAAAGADQAERQAQIEGATLQAITAEWKQIWNEATAGNEEFQRSVAALGDALRSLTPIIQAFSDTLANVGGPTMRLIADGFDLFIKLLLETRVGALNLAIALEKVADAVPFVDRSAAIADLQALREAVQAESALITLQMRARGAWEDLTPSENLRQSIEYLAQAQLLLSTETEGLLRVTGATRSEYVDLVASVDKWGRQAGLNEGQIRRLKEEAARLKSELSALGETDVGDLGFVDLDTKLRALRDAFAGLQVGENLVSAMRGLGVAYRDMVEDMNPSTAQAYMTQFNRVLEMVVFNGIESLNLLRLQARMAFEAGLLPENAFNQLIEGYAILEEAAKPFQAEADKIREKMGLASNEGVTALGRIAGGLDTTSASAQGAAGFIGQVASALLSLPTQVSTSIYVGLTGPGAGLISGGGMVAAPTMAVSKTPSTTTSTSTRGITGISGGVPSYAQTGWKPPTTTTPKTTTTTTGSYTPPAGWEGKQMTAAQREAQRLRNEARWRDVIGRSTDFWDPRRGGGGGGGGGGAGRDERLATIEEIRKFMDQVNRAILAGVRGGLAFSTAGNAIPLGGPGQFMSSQGGVLIETVNLRGVWDFADPAAKREMVRQLKEALREFEREVA